MPTEVQMSAFPDTDRHPWPSRRELPWLLAILAVALILRVYKLGDTAIWVDEGVYLNHFSQGFLAQWSEAAKDGYPPLWFFYAYPFYALNPTEFFLRLSSIPPLLGSVWMTAALGRQLGHRAAGLAAAGVLALSSYSLEYSQALKYISFFDFLCLVWFYAFLKTMAAPQPLKDRWFWVWTTMGVLCIWTHYLAFFQFAAQGLFVLGWRRKFFVPFVIGSVLAAVSFVPWVFVLSEQTGRLLAFVGWGPMWEHLKTLPFLAFPNVFRAWAGGNYLTIIPQNVPLLVLTCGAQGLLLVVGWKTWRKDAPWLLCLMGVPMVLTWLMMLAGGWWFHPRYFSQVFPLYCLLVGVGLVTVWNSQTGWARTLSAFTIVGVTLSTGQYISLLGQAPNNRTAIAHIREHFQEGDLLVEQPPYMFSFFDYYWPEHPPIASAERPENYRLGMTPTMARAWVKKKKAEGVQRIWFYTGLGHRNSADNHGYTFRALAAAARLEDQQAIYAYPAKFTKDGQWALFDLTKKPRKRQDPVTP